MCCKLHFTARLLTLASQWNSVNTSCATSPSLRLPVRVALRLRDISTDIYIYRPVSLDRPRKMSESKVGLSSGRLRPSEGVKCMRLGTLVPVCRIAFRRARHGIPRFVYHKLVLPVCIPVDVQRVSIQRPVRVCLCAVR